MPVTRWEPACSVSSVRKAAYSRDRHLPCANLCLTFSGAVKGPAPGYFPLALIALRNCASASSLQYLQLSWRKTEV
jgi:hypothetical protein